MFLFLGYSQSLSLALSCHWPIFILLVLLLPPTIPGSAFWTPQLAWKTTSSKSPGAENPHSTYRYHWRLQTHQPPKPHRSTVKYCWGHMSCGSHHVSFYRDNLWDPPLRSAEDLHSTTRLGKLISPSKWAAWIPNQLSLQCKGGRPSSSRLLDVYVHVCRLVYQTMPELRQKSIKELERDFLHGEGLFYKSM